MQRFTSSSIEELSAVADEVLDLLRGRERQHGAAVLALTGDLGAGKTTFTQLLAKRLGVNETVTSPTFVIMRHYELSDDAPFNDLYHLDAYRIEETAELTPLRLEDYLADPEALVVIEWADKIREALPDSTWWLDFTQGSGETREVTLTQSHG